MRKTSLVAALLAVAAAAGCAGEVGIDDSSSTATAALSGPELEGRTTWFNATFGGEKFFSLILPGPPFNLALGFDTVLVSDRNTRFNEFGVLNDPDCVQGDATTGGLDRCADDAQIGSYNGASAGIVGVRKFLNPLRGQPGQKPIIVGVSCASCHAGLDAQNPPADPNHPAWANIHATTGNQYINVGKIFGAHLSSHDPRYQVFHTWAPGTVDTTAIESDHVNNPGIITQVFNLSQRPFFDLTVAGEARHVHRAGQGGEDDAGCEAAAIRVYFNIGMCAKECMVGHLANGPGGSQTPIDQAECAAVCPDFNKAKEAVVNMCKFMNTTTPPSLAAAPGGQALLADRATINRGKQVFNQQCASCHGGAVASDDLIHPADEIGTNSCRSKTSNWQDGHIWAQFSSDQYKARPTGGPGYYRDVPLLGIWATAPFLHNNRLGVFTGDSSVAGRVAAYEEAMGELLNPLSRDIVGSIQSTTDSIEVPTPIGNVTLPAGTPVALFANLNPNNPLENFCPDLAENQGHYYGAWLWPSDKHALTEYLKTR
ncbi:MAG: lipoprotein cytochrome c [Myxococcales bacterium]|nr:lipoprotein cytochrome c [Myxococcales bacterium]